MIMIEPYIIFFLYLPGPNTLFWTSIIFIRVYVGVCMSFCLSVHVCIDYLKKLLTDFD